MGSRAWTLCPALCLVVAAPRVESSRLVGSDEGEQQPDTSQQWLEGESGRLDDTKHVVFCSQLPSAQCSAAIKQTQHVQKHTHTHTHPHTQRTYSFTQQERIYHHFSFMYHLFAHLHCSANFTLVSRSLSRMATCSHYESKV